MAPHFDTWPTFIGLRNWSSRACPVCACEIYETEPPFSFFPTLFSNFSRCYFFLFFPDSPPFFRDCYLDLSTYSFVSICILGCFLVGNPNFSFSTIFFFRPALWLLSGTFLPSCNLHRNFCGRSVASIMKWNVSSQFNVGEKTHNRGALCFLIQITFSFFKVVTHSDGGMSGRQLYLYRI